jgi:hypothetical protein
MKDDSAIPEGLPLPSNTEVAEDTIDEGGTIANIAKGDMKIDRKTMLKNKVDLKNKAESDNDIEWLVDSYSANVPEGEKKGIHICIYLMSVFVCLYLYLTYIDIYINVYLYS